MVKNGRNVVENYGKWSKNLHFLLHDLIANQHQILFTFPTYLKIKFSNLGMHKHLGEYLFMTF
jgi:hypothetical protein